MQNVVITHWRFCWEGQRNTPRIMTLVGQNSFFSHRPESMLPNPWGSRLHVILEDVKEGNMVSNDGKPDAINIHMKMVLYSPYSSLRLWVTTFDITQDTNCITKNFANLYQTTTKWSAIENDFVLPSWIKIRQFGPQHRLHLAHSFVFVLLALVSKVCPIASAGAVE